MKINSFFNKTLVFILFAISFCAFGQERNYVLIDSQTRKNCIRKDSVSAAQFLDSLSQNNYYFIKVSKVEEDAASIKVYFDKGKNFNKAQVFISKELSDVSKNETSFYTQNLDSLKRSFNKIYADQGFAFSRVKTKYLGMKEDIPQVEISVHTDEQRKINGFVIKGYEKVPKRFVKNIEKEFVGKSYDGKTLLEIQKNFQNHPFVSLERNPQTLFTKDSTQIFLFLLKKKSNTFDGVIGFGNDKTEKFTLNGTMNVKFNNIFNSFESTHLYWQRNPDKGQTFDLKVDVPYMFKTNLGVLLNTNIYRQDSTFANVRLLPSVYYNLSFRQKIGVRGTFENSSVLDETYILGKDYNKKGVGLWYQFTAPTDIELFLFNSRILAEADIITTKYGGLEEGFAQQRYFLSGEHNFHLKGNHFINFRGESALLNAKEELSTNELFRFGGWNSLRGFNENSLVADFYALAGAEYRYLIGEQAFFDVFGQYAQLNNKSINEKPKFYSFGIGFNFFLPIGLMSFQISNGTQFGNPIKFGDTKIHWGILSRF